MSVFIFDENDDARQCGSYYTEIVDQGKRENGRRRNRMRKSLSQIATRENIVLSCRIFSLISYITTSKKKNPRDTEREEASEQASKRERQEVND